jgi:polar amino acid transport system substrate-binding protein
MKHLLGTIVVLIAAVALVGCNGGGGEETAAQGSSQSTLARVTNEGTLVIGTAPGYMPFEMKSTDDEFIGYDIDLGRAIAESMSVDVEFKQYAFSGLIPALQTGEIDMIIAGMTIRGDRALAVSFSKPYYSTGQVIMVPAGDTSTESWQDLDVEGKTIAGSQGTTGALLAKRIFENAEVVDFDDFPTSALALSQGQVDAVVYDEPAIRMYETQNPDAVRGIYDLITKENLGIAVAHNDFATVLWLNSFLESWVDSTQDLASRDKWFESTDWMENVEE